MILLACSYYTLSCAKRGLGQINPVGKRSGGYFFFSWASTEHSQGKTVLESARHSSEFQLQVRTLQQRVASEGLILNESLRGWRRLGRICLNLEIQ